VGGELMDVGKNKNVLMPGIPLSFGKVTQSCGSTKI